ncbi:MAG: MraZ family transcriptional regulator [Fibrobacter sp.]|nr:MraZ family transcriptional regulator [Fibrobacter sp.]
MNFEKQFIGQAKSAIDGKGRCAFPREFRRQMTHEDGSEFVLTNWMRDRLRLFVRSEYEKFMDEVDRWPNRKDAQQFRLGLRATLVELDGQNRILLPKDKILRAGLTNSVTFVDSVGGKSLELWNTERYEAISPMDTEEGLAKFEELCTADFAGGLNDQK